MGLGITAYKNITMSSGNEAFDDEGDLIQGDPNKWFQVYKNVNFPGRADDIEDRKAYKAEDSVGFRVGSYNGYGWWREELAKLAGYAETEYEDHHGHTKMSFSVTVWFGFDQGDFTGPFAELICFSDCEGVIGNTISMKLAKDFEEFQERANIHESERFKNLYKGWKEVFNFASDRGCVEFH